MRLDSMCWGPGKEVPDQVMKWSLFPDSFIFKVRGIRNRKKRPPWHAFAWR